MATSSLTSAPRSSGAHAPLERRAARGAMLSVANVGAIQLLRLAGNLVTTRLLYPEAYGLMLLVLVLMQGLQMVSDVGLVPSIIQHERGQERDFIDTAWTLQLVRGAIITALALAVAWPYARFYGQPELFGLVIAASCQGILGGFESTNVATLNRKLQLGRLALVDVLGQVVTVVVMIAWALYSPSVWALIGGALAGIAARVVASHVALPGPPNRLRWEPEAVVSIFRFGRWIFVSTLVTYLALQLGSFTLGKLLEDDLELLGVYGVGQSLAGLPMLLLGQVMGWVLLPTLSEARRAEPERFADIVRRARRSMNAIGAVVIVGTATAAPAFFYLLYDHRYHGAGWMVQLLMVSSWFLLLQSTAGYAQLAMGDSRAQMIANLVNLSASLPGSLAGFWIGERAGGHGLAGLLLGLAVGSLAGYATIARGLRAKGIDVWRQDLRWTLVGAALAIAGTLAPRSLGPLLGVEPPLLSVAACALVVVPHAAWTLRRLGRELGSPLLARE
ncbi:MAG: oligosaccharide flippase family protein [Sandaracinaceae bacterium]|nr:oligosaccharide flippase family protein [Sandaracinaceae bacterium]